MNKNRLRLISLIFIISVAGYQNCLANDKPEILSQFQWQFPTAKIPTQTLASVQIKNYQIQYTPDLKNESESFKTILNQLDEFLVDRFQLKATDQVIKIRLLDGSKYQNKNIQIFNTNQGLVFPYLIDRRRDDVEFSNLSAFNFVHAIIKAHLIFGSEDRIFISSHAFRFADGLSGYLALLFLETRHQIDRHQILAYLDLLYIKSERYRQVSSSQMLSQNASSEETDVFAGYGQFLNGLTLSRDSNLMTQLQDQSSTADRIRVFSYINNQFGKEATQEIIRHLKKAELLWDDQSEVTDSFCEQYVRVGCESPSLDGTRSDIILKTVTGKKYAVLLKASKLTEKPQSVPTSDDVPATVYYGFNFPKAGGSSESRMEITGILGQSTIQKNDILETTLINNRGVRLSFGFQDEVYETQFLFQYTTGEKIQDDEFEYNNNTLEAPQTIEHTELLIGGLIGDNGKLDLWGHEMALLFHWIRIKSEWNLEKTRGKKTDLEFINRGYFLLDWQNYSFIKLSDNMDLGMNYNLQTGLVSHSGSTVVARSEKYNKDTTTWILGTTIGTEIRFPLEEIYLDAHLGADYTYLWQPFDEKGGKSGGGKINSTQSITNVYASFSLVF